MAGEKQDFESVVEYALDVEKDALGHTEYSGSLEIKRVVDFSPDKYADMSFDDLLMQYNRFEKIRKASQFDYLSGRSTSAPPQAKAKSQELEAKVKEISEASLHKADEMSKAFENAPELKTPEKQVSTFEFEKGWEVTSTPPSQIEKPAAAGPAAQLPAIPVSEKNAEPKKAMEFEDFSTESLKVEGEGPAESKTPERVARPKPEVQKPAAVPEDFRIPARPAEKEEDLTPLEKAALRFPERKLPEEETAKLPEIPPVLSVGKPQLPSVAPGESVFDRVQRTFDSEWGDERDETKIKRKMLELTKDLFREKLASRREEIKRQIVVLKNLLEQPEEKKKGKKDAKEDTYSSSLFTTLSGTLSTEFTGSLNSLSNEAEAHVSEAMTKFKLSLADIPEGSPDRKAAFDRFVFELTAINEKFSSQSDEFWKSISSRHIAALEQFEASVKDGDKASLKKAQEKKDELPSAYQHEVSLFKSNLANKVNSMMDSSSYSILAGQRSEAPAPQEAPKKQLLKKSSQLSPSAYPDIISEINQIDEGSLMYYLHSRDPSKYREFERGRISRREALMEARIRMAEEKSLPKKVIEENWGVI